MAIHPFTIQVAQSTLDDLRSRLARTRWPDEVEGAGWDDEFHLHNGLWDYADEAGNREIYEPLADELRRQQGMFKRARRPQTGEVNVGERQESEAA